jgi:hypothetical protein
MSGGIRKVVVEKGSGVRGDFIGDKEERWISRGACGDVMGWICLYVKKMV